MFLLCSDDCSNFLFNAQVDHLITVIGENDVNKILADVMNISLDSCNQEFRFC